MDDTGNASISHPSSPPPALFRAFLSVNLGPTDPGGKLGCPLGHFPSLSHFHLASLEASYVITFFVLVSWYHSMHACQSHA